MSKLTWNEAIITTLRKYLQGKQKRNFLIRELYTKDFIKKLQPPNNCFDFETKKSSFP